MRTKTKQIEFTEKQLKSLDLAIFNASLYSDIQRWPKRFNLASIDEIKTYDKLLSKIDEYVMFEDYKNLRNLIIKHYDTFVWRLLPYNVYNPLYNLAVSNEWL